MSDTSMPRPLAPLRLDSTAITGQSLDVSPSRSSVRSSSSQSQVHTPSSSVPDTPLLPNRPSSPERRPPHPGDSNSFLTALAAQERRVLELREELQEADEDLERLKRQWAVHEATKKKNELLHLQQLQPLNPPPIRSNLPVYDDSERASREVDRQRITPSNIKPSQRKIFAGSRHTQALSLLSRDPKSHSDTLLRGNESSKSHQAATNDVVVPADVPVSSSLDVESGSDNLYRGPQKDVILETGKQLVGDFRQGLWTFFEDFKQLTIGDEGIGTADQHSPFVIAPGNMPRRQNMREKKPAIRDSPARKAGALDVVQEPSQKVRIEIPVSNQVDISHKGRDPTNSIDSDDEGRGRWDTPKGSIPRRKDPVDGVDPMAFPLPGRGSPGTSMSSCDATPRPKKYRISVEDKDDIPWSALTKLTPGSLKRTASTLMSEWERNPAQNAHDEADPPANAAPTNGKTG